MRVFLVCEGTGEGGQANPHLVFRSFGPVFGGQTSLERMLKRIRSPDRVRTMPDRAETPSIVPVFALRFPGAGLRYILPSSRRTPASGRVSRKIFPIGRSLHILKGPDEYPRDARFLAERPDPSLIWISSGGRPTSWMRNRVHGSAPPRRNLRRGPSVPMVLATVSAKKLWTLLVDDPKNVQERRGLQNREDPGWVLRSAPRDRIVDQGPETDRDPEL